MTKLSLHEENIFRGNEAEIFANVKNGKTAVKDCKGLLMDLSGRSNRKMLCFVANDRLTSDVNQSECIGTVNILQEENKDDLKNKIKADEQKTKCSNIESKEEIKDEKLNVEVGEEKKKDPEVLEYTATVSGKYKVNENYCHVTAACVLDNTSLMIFDHANDVLKRLSIDDFKIIDQLNFGVNSFSICSVGTEEVAVALCYNRMIQLVAVGRTMTLTRSFSTDQRCRGVAFSEVSGEFYVSNHYNKVNVYDKNGKLMKTYDKDNKGRSMFSYTCNVAWNEDKTILYVTDGYTGLIALSKSGELLWTFNDAELICPHGLCVLPGDVILVSGVGSHNVIQVDKRGKKLGTLLGAKDNLYGPYALAYGMDRSRLIVGHRSNEIHVYNLVKK
jgi:hypothetical protein